MSNAALCVVVDGRFVPLALVAWVALYFVAVWLFVTLPEWVKPRLRWLTAPRKKSTRRG